MEEALDLSFDRLLMVMIMMMMMMYNTNFFHTNHIALIVSLYVIMFIGHHYSVLGKWHRLLGKIFGPKRDE